MTRVYHARTIKQHELFPVYSVYALIDPRDQAIRYIGMSKHPIRRMREHAEHRYDSTYDWIQELLQAGLEPTIEILETNDDRHEAVNRENHWIRHYVVQGLSLLNKHPYKKRGKWVSKA